jgi:hypothetical protein
MSAVIISEVVAGCEKVVILQRVWAGLLLDGSRLTAGR